MKKKLVVLAVFILGALVSWWLGIVKPNLWMQEHQFNFTLLSENRIILVTIDPEKETVFAVTFPKNLLIETFGNYGEVRVGKLKDLAFQEKKEIIIPKSLEYFFGFPLDFWFYRENESVDFSLLKAGEGVGRIKKEVDSLLFSTQKITISERINLWRVRNWLGKRHLVSQIEKGEEKFCQEEGGFYQLNQEVWDNWASIYLADPGLKNEHLSIGVYNLSGVEGLAGKLARILTNSGMFVAAVKDQKVDNQNCLLGIKSLGIKETLTFRRLTGLIDDCEIKLLPEKDFIDSTEINIYLKESFAKLR